ncbi:Lipase 1 [Grifola frondosa]|uniref:Carboxylic ester hydrolase n=1 Tax=Grifola frondosa TaxID=5627 RepID=A0A1C7LKX7_GRIFR|nr:Lipase 1 [Grifola frondosa]
MAGCDRQESSCTNPVRQQQRISRPQHLPNTTDPSYRIPFDMYILFPSAAEYVHAKVMISSFMEAAADPAAQLSTFGIPAFRTHRIHHDVRHRAWYIRSLEISLSVATTCPSLTPTVKIDNATIIGTSDGVVSQFLGIPFALPPIGSRRLHLPQPIQSYTGIVNATTFGDQCMQQPLADVDLPADLPPEISAFLSISSAILNITQSEDCLNLNVITPAGTTVYSKLPVVVWIYGGGFQFGSNAADPGNVIVNKSIELQQPVIYVAMNYRLSALGFLGGKEVKDAGVGNLGLHDQREALRWVQKYISLFGGDPTKVTIWGESAGAVSVAMQMLTSDGNTEGLFHAGFMNSGSVLPNGKIDNAQLQSTYDFIV